jgi:hypothetical protein
VLEDTEAFGGACAIELDRNGNLIGWADERRTNYTSGY